MSSKKLAKDYYSSIASGYEELYGEEQLSKLKGLLERVDFQKSDIVLDVGCGTGLLDYFICGMVSWIVGVDLSRAMIEKRRLCSSGDFLICDAENLPFREHVFDKVLSFTVVQNLEDPYRMLKEIKRVCRETVAITILRNVWSLRRFQEMVGEFLKSCEVFEIGKDLVCIGNV